MSHTPGPWQYMPAVANEFAPGVRGSDGFYVATLADGCAPSLTDANARLIAAAPDLLAALEQAREAMMHPTGHQSEWKDVQENKAIATANTAIAKAKGES